MNAQNFHATCVLLPECRMAGVLLTGPPQSGKSSLALELLEAGGQLVSDDQTLLTPGKDGLIATAPEGVSGLIEISGYGIVQLPPHKVAPGATLALCVTLVPAGQEVERLPDQDKAQLLSVKLPRLQLRAHDAAAAAKIRAVLHYRLLDYTDA